MFVTLYSGERVYAVDTPSKKQMKILRSKPITDGVHVLITYSSAPIGFYALMSAFIALHGMLWSSNTYGPSLTPEHPLPWLILSTIAAVAAGVLLVASFRRYSSQTRTFNEIHQGAGERYYSSRCVAFRYLNLGEMSEATCLEHSVAIDAFLKSSESNPRPDEGAYDLDIMERQADTARQLALLESASAFLTERKLDTGHLPWMYQSILNRLESKRLRTHQEEQFRTETSEEADEQLAEVKRRIEEDFQLVANSQATFARN